MANPYFIKIELPSATKKSAVANGVDGSLGGGDEAQESPSADKALKAAKKLVSFATVKSTANTIISNSISQVSLETGAQEYEQRASAIHGAANQVINTVASVGIGITTGNLPLALVGIVMSGITTVLNYSNRVKQLQLKEDLEDISIGMATVRAGISGRRSKDQ